MPKIKEKLAKQVSSICKLNGHEMMKFTRKAGSIKHTSYCKICSAYAFYLVANGMEDRIGGGALIEKCQRD